MFDFLYIEIILICTFILAVVYTYEQKRLNSHVEKTLFNSMLYVACVYLLSDLGWYLTTVYYTEKVFWLVYIFKMLFFMTRIIFVYIWFSYSELNYEKNINSKKKYIVFSLLPVFISLLLIFSTPFNHFLFTISPQGEYIRGPLYNLNFLLFLVYLVTIQYRCGQKIVLKKYYAERSKYLSIFMYCLPLLLFTIAQFFFQGRPLVCAGMAITIMQMQLSAQNQLVTIDELTGLNNRTQMLKYLHNKMSKNDDEKKNSTDSLFLFIIDVDDFKNINDTYGHVVGDEALVIVANCLKRVSGRYNCFCCRYGGDEFIMVSELHDYAAAEAIAIELNKEIRMDNFVHSNYFNLHVSVGYAQNDSSINSIPDFIDKADKMLYIIKRNKKTQDNK